MVPYARQVIRRRESDNTNQGDPSSMWYRFGGRQMGSVTNNGGWEGSYASSVAQRQAAPLSGTPGPFANGATTGKQEEQFSSNLEMINSYSQGSNYGSYNVRAGDSLQGIAQNLWGDSSLWYKLAQANGLSGTSALFEGQTLRLPSGVARNTYNASTITPYNPGETLGDVTPSTPQATPPKKQKCGGVGQILMMVIAVVVTAIVAPHLIAAVSNFMTGAAVSATAVAAGTATLAAGSTVIGGALAAAAGSIASQAFGVATGIQEKFSWKAVGMAALSGGIGGGLGKAFGGITNATLRAAAQGAASSAISQGIGVTLGLQDKFNWAAVAAAGVAAGFGAAAGQAMGNAGINVQAFSSRIGIGMASAIGSATAHTLIEGTDFGDNLRAALPSAIGNAIGGYITEGGGSGPGLLEAVAAGGVKPLEIKPTHDKIEIKSPQTELDPVTAVLPPLVEQNEQYGPSNFGLSNIRYFRNPDDSDASFGMEMPNYNGLRQMIDRGINELAPKDPALMARGKAMSQFGSNSSEGIESYLVSRPIDSYKSWESPKNHMFVIVYDHNTNQVMERFSYGPEKDSLSAPGNLVALTDIPSKTNRGDETAVGLLQGDLWEAAKAGISISKINASPEAVIKAGKLINSNLSSHRIGYFLVPWRVGSSQSASNVANSNSAAYALAQLALSKSGTNSNQLLPRGADNPGWNAYKVVTPPLTPSGSNRGKR